MSRTARRLVALPIGLIALADHLLLTFTAEPMSRRIHPTSLGLVFWLAAAVVSLGVPVLFYSQVVSPLRGRPASLLVEADRFVAPASPRVSGVQAILLMWFAGGVPLAERVPNGDHMRLATSSVDVTFSVTAASICAVLAVAVLCLKLRAVVLEPDGLVIRRLRRHRRIRWEELVPGGPPPPAKPGGRLTFRLRYPQPGAVPPDREDVMTSYLDVDPGFLAAVVRHYVDQPDHRHAIGTPDELTRLRTALLGAGVS